MVVKCIFRYLRGTTNQALFFCGSNIALYGYVDVDMVVDKDNKMSTSGYVLIVGGINSSWVSKLQIIVLLSTTKVDYVASTQASKEIIWLQRFMDKFGMKQEMAMLYSDN